MLPDLTSEDATRVDRLMHEFVHLANLGLHLYPIGSDKRPVGQWAHGALNYVDQPMRLIEAGERIRDPQVDGWAVLCGNKDMKVFVLDVEATGMQFEEIRTVLASLPEYAKRPSPRGGQHVVLQVIEGDAIPTERLARVGGVLLAEVRGVSCGDGNGSYAVLTGRGRGPLQDNFAPLKVTYAQAQDILAPIRALNEEGVRERGIRINKEPSAPDVSVVTGSGTGGVISQALADGSLCWLDLLDPGWTHVGEGRSAMERVYLLRPSYGEGDEPSSADSANAQGNVLVVHSTAVPWAEPGEAFNPPQVVAAAWFEGDFAAAMRAVESAARAHVERHEAVPGPFDQWPAFVLEQVHAARKQAQRDFMVERDSTSGRLVLAEPVPVATAGWLGRDDLRHLPAPEPLIAETLDRGTIAALVGRPGTYKSFCALDWSCSIATGTAWMQRDAVPGRVVYVAAEGVTGMNSRITAWEKHHEVIVGNDRLIFPTERFAFADRGSVDRLLEIVADGGTRLVVIDTLARCAIKLEENSAQDMGMVVAVAQELLDATDRGVVLLVHHSGKTGDSARGSSALEGGLDTLYKVKAASKPSMVLSRDKRKDGPQSDTIRLRAIRPAEADSLVLVNDSSDRSEEHATSANQERILACLRGCDGGGLSVSQICEMTGLSKSSAYNAVDKMKKCGSIGEDTSGVAARYFLAVAG